MAEILLTFGVGFVCFVGLVGLLIRLMQVPAARRKQMASVAAELGLVVVPTDSGAHLEGTLDGAAVTIRMSALSHGDDQPTSRFTSIRVGAGALLPLVNVAGKGLLERAVQDGWRVGDPDFDDVLEASGEMSSVMATLSAKGRTALIAALQIPGARLAGGELQCTRAGWGQEREWLVETTRRLVRSVPDLRVGRDEIARRLADNARTDPIEAVRRACERALLEHHGASEMGRAVARARLESSDPQLAFLSAQALAREGDSRMEQLVSSSASPLALRLEALEALARSGYDRLDDVLELCLGHEETELRTLALRITFEQERRVMLPACRRLTVSGDLAEANALAEVLVRLTDPLNESALLPLLDVDDDDVRMRACHGLEVIGTRLAVRPLLDLSSEMFLAAGVKLFAEDAVAAIRARLAGDAAAGGLSLSEADESEGQLSVAIADDGHLSTV